MKSPQETVPVPFDKEMYDSESGRNTFAVLGVPIAATSAIHAMARVREWLQTGVGTKLVTFANVHMLTVARRDPSFLQILKRMDMNCPDGMPLVWLGKLNTGSACRVSGPDFMPAFCSSPAANGYSHFFYGGSQGVAEQVASTLRKANPGLKVAGWFSPPFIPLSKEEDERVVQIINESKADIVWVCLGCPKQERWMAEHRDRLNARVVFAVGLAFDTIAGKKARAPLFLQSLGLEWLFRLMTDPRRLLKRYLSSNMLFAYALLQDVMLDKIAQHRSS